MTEQEYLDAKRFPLTTQKGLTLRQQKMIDAVNLDDLKQMQERGEPLDEERRKHLLELQTKSSLGKSPPPT